MAGVNKKGLDFSGGLPARKIINLSSESLVKIAPLFSDETFPLLVEPIVEGVDLANWMMGHWQQVEEKLLDAGAMLFRGFKDTSVDGFGRIIRASGLKPLVYSYGSTPRKEISDIVYTSTEYPAEQSIPLHNEMSYTSQWPMKLWFLCVTPARIGGQTPLADSRRVCRAISPRVKETFARKGVRYVRNYGDGMDVPWQEVFRTTKKSDVEALCRQYGIEFEWKGDNRLQTRQVTPALARHPKTGDEVWFNQAHLFHLSSLSPEVSDSLLAACGPEELPRNAYYGDGSEIEPSVLSEIRKAYQEETVEFTWMEADVLVLENMLIAHGRSAFEGPRRILVGMADPSDSVHVMSPAHFSQVG